MVGLAASGHRPCREPNISRPHDHHDSNGSTTATWHDRALASRPPGITDDERRTIAEMMAKGTYAIIVLATKDLDGTFERLQATNADIVQEPTEQPYGVRDCAVRDPAGSMIRIQEVS